MNFLDILILIIFVGAIISAIIFIVRRKKRGKNGCASCSQREYCQDRQCKQTGRDRI